MKYLKNILLLFVFILIIKTGYSQDIHFSQNHLSPLLLNPANTGNYNGNWRLSNILRSQWKKFADPGYQSVVIGYDQKFDNIYKGLNLGGIVVQDRSGSVNMSVSKILLTASYKKIIGKNVIRGGLQLGWVFKQFDNATYSTQFDWTTGSINPTLPNLEYGIDESINFLDVNAGILWKRKIGWFEPEVGISFFHLNNPKERFTDLSGRKRIRSMYSIGGRIIASNKLYIIPVVFYQRIQNADNLLGGVRLQFNLDRNQNHINYFTVSTIVRSGFNRQTDAAIISFGVSVDRFIFGFSFDANISEIQTYTNNVGAFEIGIIYTGLIKSFDPNSLPCSRE